jgi:hypothetical protein
LNIAAEVQVLASMPARRGAQPSDGQDARSAQHLDPPVLVPLELAAVPAVRRPRSVLQAAVAAVQLLAGRARSFRQIS